MSRHERDFQPIGDLGDDVGFRQKAKEFLPDGIREWGDEETERNHLDHDNIRFET
jgi:hypothetical protein